MRRLGVLLWALLGCDSHDPRAQAAPPPEAPRTRTPAAPYTAEPPANRYAYIPPQCFTKTKDERGDVVNPCYVCHTEPQPPNSVNDAALQLRRRLPEPARTNPWSNLFAPAFDRVPALSDDEMLRYVRESNYVRDGQLVLPAALAELPAQWDADADAKWDGFVPDAYFQFDAQGFDHAPDGTRTGWRAFAYAPLPGTYFPTNGSGSEVLIRLAPALRQAEDGSFDAEVELSNYAVVEALITRAPGASRLRYLGKARSWPVAVGLFPEGTEFLHGLRYLDVRDGNVVMAKRVKELRYARKERWLTPDELKTATRAFAWRNDRGLDNGKGWLLQGFIEDARGALRPQTHEETLFCAGCHGGIGATTDSMFAFARKLTAPDDGWFHWSRHGFEGLAEPRRTDGQYEYELYLRQNRAGDDFRDNDELSTRFFDGVKPRPELLASLHTDLASLLMPSVPRALMLNHAYRAVVVEQSFTRGRDAVFKPSPRVHRRAPADKPTGVSRPLLGQLRR